MGCCWSEQQSVRAAASQAGQAGCRAGPARGGPAAAGAGSSSGGSAVGGGVAGTHVGWGLLALPQLLASEGRDGAAEPAAEARGGDAAGCCRGGTRSCHGGASRMGKTQVRGQGAAPCCH